MLFTFPFNLRTNTEFGPCSLHPSNVAGFRGSGGFSGRFGNWHTHLGLNGIGPRVGCPLQSRVGLDENPCGT